MHNQLNLLVGGAIPPSYFLIKRIEDERNA